MFMSVWKIIVFFTSTILILYIKGETVGHLFSMFGDAFGNHTIVVRSMYDVTGRTTDIADIVDIDDNKIAIPANVKSPIYVLLLQIFSAYFMYIFGKCKFTIFSVNLTLEGTKKLVKLIYFCNYCNCQN